MSDQTARLFKMNNAGTYSETSHNFSAFSGSVRCLNLEIKDVLMASLDNKLKFFSIGSDSLNPKPTELTEIQKIYSSALSLDQNYMIIGM